jgi:transcriptional regulator with XRE-family HTH domain
MREVEIGVRLLNTRRLRTWTQGRLAKEAGLSPTTVSMPETGRIARPHFGTLHKLAQALDVEPQVLLSSSEEPRTSKEPSASEETSGREGSPPLSLQWARSAREEKFEQLIEGASLETLRSLV